MMTSPPIYMDTDMVGPMPPLGPPQLEPLPCHESEKLESLHRVVNQLVSEVAVLNVAMGEFNEGWALKHDWELEVSKRMDFLEDVIRKQVEGILKAGKESSDNT